MSDNKDAQELEQPPAKKQKVDNNVPVHCANGNQPEKLETVEENKSVKNYTASDDKYNHFVAPDEVEKLREFKVLDEVKSNDEDSNGECDDSDSSTGRLKVMSDNTNAQELEQLSAKKQKVDKNEPVPNGNQHEELENVEEIGSVKDYTTSDDKYNDFVTPEEVEKLREFRVLDEVKSNDEDSNGECEDSDSSTGESVELPEEEIEKMLEEDLPDGFKAAPKPKEKAYVTREKVILEEKGVNHFEVLPLDWIMIRHQSGIPVYVHRATRVCTLSKPYFLGKGNAKRHDIPISAIPCLAYRRALEEEEKQKIIDAKIEEQIKLGTWNVNTSQTDKLDTSGSNLKDKVKELTHTSEHKGTVDEKAADKSKETSNGQSDLQSPQIMQPQAVAVVNNLCPFRNGQISDINGDTTNIASNKGNNKNEQNSICISNNVLEENTEKKPDAFNSDNDTVPSKNQEIKNENLTNKDENGKASAVNVDIPLNRQPIVLPGGIVMPSPRVETVDTSWKTQHLTHEQVNDYCKKLFKFRVLSIMHFNRWADRRKYTKARKALQCPMLPEGTKLITIPVKSTSGQENSATGKTTKRDWVMNMNGRSYLSVFHEYVRRALQKQPVYEFKQLENASTPYQATVFIGGMQYGVGHGSSKRQAKSAAARASIHILIPEMCDHLEPDNDADPEFVFFDYVGIEDPRIAEFCAATCEPTPHAILRTCLLRNFGAGDRHIHTEMKKLEYQKIELTMKVGKHSATVVCKNKKTAKQRASQAILQALHPHVRSWGSLLRLYGSRSVKSCKEKKLEEQQITLLQDKARHNEPNYAVLEKLRHEMSKLRERDEAVVPIGTLLLTDDLPTHSGSNLNNVEL